MATRNPITNDLIISKATHSKEYDENYDRIFPEKIGTVKDSVTGIEYPKCSKRCWMDVKDGVKTCFKQGCEGGLS